MDENLRLLVALQDLDGMIGEFSDLNKACEEKDLGFRIDGLEKLKGARQELRDKIERRLLYLYDRIAERHGRAVVPVRGQICLGCFAALPTAVAQRGRSNMEIITCERCGRILYWL